MRNSSRKKHLPGDSNDEEIIDGKGLNQMVGLATGEEEGYETISGGWEGTDDATSTAPSDLIIPIPSDDDINEEPDASLGRAYGGGMAKNGGGIADLKGTPVEDSRDWVEDPIVPQQ